MIVLMHEENGANKIRNFMDGNREKNIQGNMMCLRNHSFKKKKKNLTHTASLQVYLGGESLSPTRRSLPLS